MLLSGSLNGSSNRNKIFLGIVVEYDSHSRNINCDSKMNKTRFHFGSINFFSAAVWSLDKIMAETPILWIRDKTK